ncbi:MAG: TIGR04086 family membrane protein [Oscillospiraceae bacterium]|nr:TIGR04086 family membrane protein [Oscillospiraceae bacterium]
MRRTSFVRKVIDSQSFSSFISVLSGVAVLILCLFGFSCLLTIIDANNAIKSVMSGISLCLGAFASGFICAKQKRRRGLINGLFCGLFVYLAVFCIGFLLLKITIGSGVFGKLMLVCILGAAGGVCGVNSKHNFKASKPKKNRFGT